MHQLYIDITKQTLYSVYGYIQLPNIRIINLRKTLETTTERLNFTIVDILDSLLLQNTLNHTNQQ